MKNIFADTFYWTASINSRDNWHGQVIAITGRLEQFCLVTTEEVLAKTLTFFQLTVVRCDNVLVNWFKE